MGSADEIEGGDCSGLEDGGEGGLAGLVVDAVSSEEIGFR